MVMMIKNYKEILSQPLTAKERQLREVGMKCIELAIKGVRPSKLIERALKVHNNQIRVNHDSFNLQEYEHIYLIGGGKATAEMAFTLERILTEKLKFQNLKGYINIPQGLKVKDNGHMGNITINHASHPVPNEEGAKGVREMMDLVKEAGSDDLIFCLISGGGSALLPMPKPNISLDELQEVNSLLLESGASIKEINAVRKHLSQFKGGNLAKEIYESGGATLIALIISDVIGDDLDSIASGPTVPDSTTFQDAIRVLKDYNLWEQVPISVRNTLEQGLNDNTLENPKQDHPCFNKVFNYLIGSVKDAINEVSQFLTQEDFEIEYFSKSISGEAKDFGRDLCNIIEEEVWEMGGEHLNRLALLGSGELTVTVQSDGIGGRNQEMLLSFLRHCIDSPIDYNIIVIGANLDGIEGNSNAMGALVDSSLVDTVRESYINLEKYLLKNDSNTFFKRIGTELITGPTGCNVNDIVIVLIER
jgi:glycerate-2-kinase